MIEIIISVSALLLILAIFLWIRKKKSVVAQPETKTPPATKSEAKPQEKIIAATEPVVQPVAEKTVSEPVTTSQTVSPAVVSQPISATCSATAVCNKNLPQDSMLRRHYLTHVRAMISALNAPRPTDSALSRHYDSHIAAELERCLNDKHAMQQLLDNYQQHKRTITPVCSNPVTVTPEPETKTVVVQHTVTVVETPVVKNVVATKTFCRLPEDSMLRRHYLTQLYAQAAANLPERPTDSMLRRHYDSLLENLVKQQLNS